MRRHCTFYCVTLSPTLQEKYEEAECLYRRVLEITELTLGKDHPKYSATLTKRAALQKKARPRVCSRSLCAYHTETDVLILDPCYCLSEVSTVQLEQR